VCDAKKIFCKIEVRHTLNKENLSFNFFFSNNNFLPGEQLFDYLKKSKT